MEIHRKYNSKNLHFNQIKLSGLDRLILLTVIADIIPLGDALIDLDKWKRMSWYC